jgi:acetyl esterase/lipase
MGGKKPQINREMLRYLSVLGLIALTGFSAKAGNLLDARQGFTTTLTKKTSNGSPVEDPPSEILKSVEYPTSLGDMAAYVSPSPNDGKKHPAIIWIVGGFSGSIGDTAWAPATPDNDQSARAFREAGIITMYPSVRGGNMNPGYHEGFYGEVNDILSARDYLSKLDYVDPNRIYLGGHSTGGTLALLVAESTDRFRAIFSFGPVSSMVNYGLDDMVFDPKNEREVTLSAPYKWLAAITKPTFVLEGTEKPSNLYHLNYMKNVCTNPLIHFCPVPGKTHFGTLAPMTKVIAEKILGDVGPGSNIQFTAADLATP